VRVSALTLNAVGAHDPLAEVVLLKCATSILEELGLKRYVLHINSIGDNDSSARYLRDVTVILRQRLRTLPDGFAERLRTNASAAIATLYEADHAVIAELPSPLDFLTAPSRKYFKEVLELLDHTGIPFVLNDKLYGDHNLYSHTIFELVEPPEEGTTDQPAHGEVLGRGGRYDNLTRAYARNAVPATGVVLAVQTKDHDGPVGRPRRKKPSACLIHIGREARIRSIALVEQLRREKIPIDQCLHVERYSEQVAYAEANQNKYVVIMGQREAHNGVAIVRNALDRSQETISLELLPQYLRQMA
jgi:histidyl-tRNA synthetase